MMLALKLAWIAPHAYTSSTLPEILLLHRSCLQDLHVCNMDFRDSLLHVLSVRCVVLCRCAEAALPRLTPTAHLQRYLSTKVHGDSSAYSHALNALLCGLDAQKQQQPEVAVFCRVRFGAVRDKLFHHQHVVTFQTCAMA
jgi:hypothetical protein